MTGDDINRAVGRRIAERRQELGLSLAAMAARCGISLQQIHKYETGQSNISIARLVTLADCLGVSAADLLESAGVQRAEVR